MYNKIGQVEYTAVGEGHISHYRRKELQKRTRRRLESSLLCWLGIGGISMNSWVDAPMCVLKCFCYLHGNL